MLTTEEKKQLAIEVEARVGAVEQMLLEKYRTLDERQKENGRRIHALEAALAAANAKIDRLMEEDVE